ncbi:uncharacterized protein LOC134244860 [Saccostrea cucullata]|uniref:uncharacterized protein LOC134244860 n=1 Tax=Saccostrea cuccullata TaxID=36930 RepID=UPI002ED470F6
MASVMPSKPEQQKPVPIQELEISPETLAFTQGKDAKNIKIKQFLCVRNVIPKTNLYQAILLENRSQDRHLQITLSSLSARQLKHANSFDLTARTFMAMQERKQKKWKREDELRLSSMNLPSLQGSENLTPCLDVMYHMPEYSVRARPARSKSREKEKSKFPKMPYSIRREQTEIATYNDKTYMTKLPEMVEVDQDALQHYDMYRGKKYLNAGATKSDERFKHLTETLKPAHLKDLDKYPLENATSKSRLSKYSSSSRVSSRESDDDVVFSRHMASKPRPSWMLTRPETSEVMTFTQGSKPRREVSVSFEDQPKKVKKSEEILESFRTMDVKKLAKSILKEKKETSNTDTQETEAMEETASGENKKVFVPGVNVYYSTKGN